MNATYEDLIRTHMRDRQLEATKARVGYGLLRSRRWERKATKARVRANRAVGRLVLE